MRALDRNILRSVARAPGRFLAVLGIIALGSGFLVGLRVSKDAMFQTAAHYLSDSGFYDFSVASTLGFTQEDVAAFSALDGVEAAAGEISRDALIEASDETDDAVRFLSLTPGMNEPKLSEGRLPEKAGECLVDDKLPFALGDAVTLSANNDSDTADAFGATTFTVVGRCVSPLYMNYERGATSLGDGALMGFIYVCADSFSQDVFSTVYLRLADMPEAYSDEYADARDAFTDAVTALAKDRAALRYQSLKDEANDKIADGEAEFEKNLADYQSGRSDADAQLADALAKLEDARAQIADARARIAEGRAELAEETASAQKKLDAGEAELADALTTLNAGETAYAEKARLAADGRAAYEAGLAEYEENAAALAQAQAQLAQAGASLDASQAQIDALLNAIAAAGNSGAAFSDGSALLAALQAGDGSAAAAADALLPLLAGSDASVPADSAALLAAWNAVQNGLSDYAANLSAWQSSSDQLNAAQTALDASRTSLNALTDAVVSASGGAYADRDALLTALRAGDASAQALTDGVLAGLADPSAPADAAALVSAYDGLAAQQSALDGQRAALESSQAKLAAAKTALDASQAQLTGLAGVIAGAALGASGGSGFADGNALLTALRAGDPSAAGAVAGVLAALSALDSSLPADAQALLDAEDAVAAGRAAYAENLAAYQAGMEKLAAGKATLDETAGQLDAGTAALAAGRAQLDAGWSDYNAGIAEAKAGRAELAAQTASAQATLDENEAKVEDAQATYDSGLTDYNDARAEADEKFSDAQSQLSDAWKELEDAREQVGDLKAPTVYVLTRDSNVGYACFESDASIVEGIARVFPLFFFLVAALVCVTTVTRMVEEERGQIGVLMALGYSRRAIRRKYLFYSGSATVLGCAIGIGLGTALFPQIIWKAYMIMYSFSDRLDFFFGWELAAVTFATYLAAMLAVTWLACRADLAEAPANVIRPRAPKAGKRVLLERLPFLWNRLSFMWKVSLRNLFRYRQRALMMILGVGGCTALMITGFGIRDSIQHIVDHQYDEITLYDYQVTFSDPQSSADEAAFTRGCAGISDGVLFLREENASIVANGREKSVYLCAVSDPGDIGSYLSFHQGREDLAYPTGDGALINSGLAELLGLSAGDQITVKNDDGDSLRLTVSGVFDNYIYNYVYVSADAIRTQWDAAPEANTAFVLRAEGTDDGAATAALLGMDGVLNIAASSSLRTRIDSMMSSLIYIVLLTIVCAAALALIVIYNLTNINITERLREIATVKVLGFYPRESASYVMRENIVLTILGAAVGIPMGIWLTSYVMQQIRIDMVAFTPRITAVSFLISVALTLLFSGLTDLLMLRKLNRINMAQALKAAE